MKFNTNTTGSNITTNRAGGPAYKLTSKEILVQIGSTYLFNEPKFYGDVNKDLNEAIEKVAKEDPEFILKFASYNRNEMYMRTVSIYILVKAANIIECKPFIRKYTPFIIKRADEITETISCQIELFGKPIPASLKKGIADSFKNFDSYQFAKYNRNTKVTFKDAIMLTHPKQPSEIIKKILDDDLEIPKTWETEISVKGSNMETWNKVVDEVFWKNNRINNYMAILRNINNIDKHCDEEHFNKVIEAIENKNAVKHSKQFPFRFYSALANTRISNPFRTKLLSKALEKALSYSVDNLPKLKGNTLSSADTSGSMTFTPISKKGNIYPLDIACLMTAMANKFSENGVASVFGSEFTTISTSDNILEDTQKLKKVNVGWSTNGYKVIEYALNNKIYVDRFIIFTDEELYGGSIQKTFDNYVKIINQNAKLYLVNLNGYGDSPVNTKSINIISFSGWSDKILNYIVTYEEGMKSQITKIENYSI